MLFGSSITWVCCMYISGIKLKVMIFCESNVPLGYVSYEAIATGSLLYTKSTLDYYTIVEAGSSWKYGKIMYS